MKVYLRHRHHHAAPPAFRAGFTLIELLVATTLLSIVMSAVYTLTHASLRSWSYAESGFDPYREARSAFTLFSHEYNNMAGRAGHLFEGDDRQITMFVIAQPMDLDEGEGRRLMRVIYRYNRNKRTLEREEALVETALPKQPPDPKEFDRSRVKVAREYKTTVAENVTDLKITYIWVPAPDDISNPNDEEPPVPVPAVYMERHDPLWGLPQGVQLAITLRDPDDDEKEYTLEATFPSRANAFRMPRESLEKMIFDEE